jgi:hypothetical protein
LATKADRSPNASTTDIQDNASTKLCGVAFVIGTHSGAGEHRRHAKLPRHDGREHIEMPDGNGRSRENTWLGFRVNAVPKPDDNAVRQQDAQCPADLGRAPQTSEFGAQKYHLVGLGEGLL